MKKPLKRRRSPADTWRMLLDGTSGELLEFRDEMHRRALRQTSIDKGLSVLVRAEHAVGHPLIESTTMELRDWLDKLGVGAKARYAYISHLSSFWCWALAEERVTKNPVLRLTRPKLRQGLPRPVQPNDLAILLEQAGPQMRAMITLAAHAGLRCMEIAALRSDEVLQHLDPPVLVVTSGKGDKPRVIPISPGTIAALVAHGIPSYGPLFRYADGRAYTPSKVSHVLRAHIHACGVNASAHQLRHSFGTEVYRRSGDLRLTQELLGHASPSSTAIYTAWAQDRAASVVATLFT